jgi:hypothetical protein
MDIYTIWLSIPMELLFYPFYSMGITIHMVAISIGIVYNIPRKFVSIYRKKGELGTNDKDLYDH